MSDQSTQEACKSGIWTCQKAVHREVPGLPKASYLRFSETPQGFDRNHEKPKPSSLVLQDPEKAGLWPIFLFKARAKSRRTLFLRALGRPRSCLDSTSVPGSLVRLPPYVKVIDSCLTIPKERYTQKPHAPQVVWLAKSGAQTIQKTQVRAGAVS